MSSLFSKQTAGENLLFCKEIWYNKKQYLLAGHIKSFYCTYRLYR